ncbi:MAG: type IV secretion system protein [Pontixanthobacter sp.]
MNAPHEDRVGDDLAYEAQYDAAGEWSRSVTADIERSKRIAWAVACVAALVAVLEAIALVYLMPLKTTVPYTLLVDRQTGNVEALSPLDAQVIAPDTALTRSFLVQYVIARESFDVVGVQQDYRKVTLWSAGEARSRYIDQMQDGNPLSPLSYMPRGGAIKTEIRSISSLGARRSLVRFTTTRSDPGAQPQAPEYWAAIVDYQFSSDDMAEADRLVNPLGFQVTRYRRDAETLPELPPQTETARPLDRSSAP